MIGVVGAGRMGRGIALAYCYAGREVTLMDIRGRSAGEFEVLAEQVLAEMQIDLEFLAEAHLLDPKAIAATLERVQLVDRVRGRAIMPHCLIIYEAVPEVREAKEAAFAFVSEHAQSDAVVASTTSTFLVTELAHMVDAPERFLNAHWLNPAHLMPLVEISRSEWTAQRSVDRLMASLEEIGKVPVVCSASAGYIVPRIQALAMNEAARLVEEGVASAEDVDKAVRYGFGPRFAVLGLLEFIDWGGGDILYYAANYLEEALSPRFAAPDIIRNNMASGRNGMRDGRGFFDYRNQDLDEYRRGRLKELIQLLAERNALPKRL
ncbi:MAG: 3-hydroxybutyryl-CoA dehydrogenase [Parahaliea sp.]